MPTRSSSSTARRRATPRPMRSWARIVSAIWSPTRCSGCSPVRASWKIMAILGTPDLPQPRRGRVGEVLAPEQHLPAGDATGAPGQQPEDRQRQHRLAAARLADDRQHLVVVQVETHPVHCGHRAALGVDLGAQVAHRQQRAPCHGFPPTAGPATRAGALTASPAVTTSPASGRASRAARRRRSSRTGP